MVVERIKIGMVLDQRFPPDARVEREATALVEAGYEVHLLCELQDDDLEREEYYRGVYVHRVRPSEVVWRLPLLNIPNRLPYRGIIKNLNRSLWNIDTVWQTLMENFVYAYGINVLHVHDLRLVSTGLAVADKYDIPLVADLHENYPALMELLKGKQNPLRGQKARKKWEKIEKTCIWQADRVITVIEEARDRLIGKGVSPKKMLVLPNTVDIEKFEAAPIDSDIIRRYKSSFLLTYVGFINDTHRGIQTVLEAMALLKDEIPELFFAGAGGTRDTYLAMLYELTRHYGLERQVDFSGWLDETEFVSYIQSADICLCPHLANDHTNATFPNKVYLYNLFSKPVITSSCQPLKRYVEESGGGMVFESGNAQSLANTIRYLYENKALRKQLGEQGRQAVLSQYNWQKSAASLIDMYHNLVGPAVEPSSYLRATSPATP